MTAQKPLFSEIEIEKIIERSQEGRNLMPRAKEKELRWAALVHKPTKNALKRVLLRRQSQCAAYELPDFFCVHDTWIRAANRSLFQQLWIDLCWACKAAWRRYSPWERSRAKRALWGKKDS